MRVKYLLAFELPEPLFTKYEKIREDYRAKRWTRRIGPHITLAPSIKLTEVNLLEVVCENIAQSTRPLEVELNGLDRFNNQDCTVMYARVAPNPSLVQLNQDLVNEIKAIAPADWGQRWPYNPHVTLANKVSQEEGLNLWERLQAVTINDSFTCSHFCIYVQTTENTWKEIRRYALSAL